MKIFFNGEYREAQAPLVKVFDRGFCFGDGVFTTIKVEGATPWFLKHHLDRLRSSCRFLGIVFKDPGFSEVIATVLKKNRLKDGRIKIMMSRGCDFDNRIYNYRAASATTAVLAFPLGAHPPKPVRLTIAPERRGEEALYHHKTISYLQNLLHKTHARKKGFDDELILNWQREILETSTANVFFIVKDKIITPPAELPLLNGIMRQQLLSLGTIKGYCFQEDSLTPKELKKVTGVFITSAILEVCPVKQIDDRTFSLEIPNAIRKEWLRVKRGALGKGSVFP